MYVIPPCQVALPPAPAAADENDNDGGRLLCVLIMTYVITKQGIAMASTMLYLSLTF